MISPRRIACLHRPAYGAKAMAAGEPGNCTGPLTWPFAGSTISKPAAASTDACEPSGVTATAKGLLPTGKPACCIPAARLAADSK